MQTGNAKMYFDLKIVKMRWLSQIIQKDFAPLLIKVNTAEQANRLINESLVIAYDLKIVK
jgi:hypothetical protein